MSKTIIIIGGGISGLAVLHYLKQKYAGRPDVEVLLLEKDTAPGGTVRSVVRNGCLFEAGPNGFLDSKPRTLEFIAGLGLADELVKAGRDVRIRYLCLNNVLHPFPMSPAGFFGFRPMRLREKLRVFAEPFVARGTDPDESVYAFGARRLGEKFSRLFLDPMVSGIYGGDARETVLRAAFGRIYELEQRYGSLFVAMMKLRKGGMPRGTLTSFRQGQGEMIAALCRRYQEHIRLNQEVVKVSRDNGRFTVTCADGVAYGADELFVSAPAYQAAAFLEDMSPALAGPLTRIRYSPLAVIGLVFERKAFPHPPAGFGYLIPSSENKEVLGVLWESNIFPNRCREDQVLMRVMIGGARHPDILSKPREALTALALKEVQTTLKTDASPVETFFVPWPKAIPQYDRAYVEAERGLEEELKKWPGLYLVANYLHGVSLNDCIENAYQAANSEPAGPRSPSQNQFDKYSTVI
ncbi:MAG: protoporphyrinogen oxidase [Candidatus Omnitrophica bacterium]|nr:protoporphyrinogen oxidase [Candidatus Omnitrophota bacterium]